MILAAAGCGRDAAPREAPRTIADDARAAAPATTDVAHQVFPSLGEAITAIIPADARVIGFGELHNRTDRPDVRPALVAFREDVMPALAPRLSDLVLETWVVDPTCGKGAQAATQRVEAAMNRPTTTQSELGKQIAAARAAGVQPHAMRLSCADYEAVAPASGIDIEHLLGLVTRELGRIATSAVVHRNKTPDHRPLIAVYGGALHNDRFPYDSVAQWSYAAQVDTATADHFVEIDLYPPELAAAEPLYAKEPWFPLVAQATTSQVLVWARGPRSWVVILPTSK